MTLATPVNHSPANQMRRFKAGAGLASVLPDFALTLQRNIQ